MTLLKYEEQLTELVDRQEEQLSEVVDRRDKHLTVMTNRRKKRLVGMADRQGQKEPKLADTPPMTPHFFKIILSPHASKLVSSSSGFMMRHFHLISFFSVSTWIAYVLSFFIFFFSTCMAFDQKSL